MMKKTFVITFAIFFVIIFACNKEDKSLPISVAPANNSVGPAPHKTFVFTGNIDVAKNDSLWAPVTSYTANSVTSTLYGTSPDFALSTTFDPGSLKGQTNNNISINIINDYFSTYTVGTGVFNQGVLSGYYRNDSLYYQVLYKGLNKSNVYLTYKGKLTRSY